MGRTRGFWWAPDGERLLVQRVNTAPVATWWITAPDDPGTAPTPIRYPRAGTANADVAVAIVGLGGDRLDIDWNAGD